MQPTSSYKMYNQLFYKTYIGGGDVNEVLKRYVEE